MPNVIEYAKIYQRELDKAFAPTSQTGWMEANTQNARYSGGKEIKIPKMEMDGLADYDREDGYNKGAVTLAYQTVEMTHDRARGFNLDAMDVDESGFVASAGQVMGEFQRTKVVPEVDAVRLMATYKAAAEDAATRTEAYTPAASSIFGKLQDHIAAVQDVVGESTPLVVHIAFKVWAILNRSTEFTRMINMAELNFGSVKTKVRSLDGVMLLPTSGAAMKTNYTFYRGEADAEGVDRKAGGFEATSDAKDINWLIIPKAAPLAPCKTDTVRVFDPQTYQNHNAWHIDYRKYFDLWIPDNKKPGLFACTK